MRQSIYCPRYRAWDAATVQKRIVDDPRRGHPLGRPPSYHEEHIAPAPRPALCLHRQYALAFRSERLAGDG